MSFASYAEKLGTVILTLHVGPKRKELPVHKNLLISATKYFDKKLSKNAEGDNTIYLADEDPEAFSILVEWLYTGGIKAVKIPKTPLLPPASLSVEPQPVQAAQSTQPTQSTPSKKSEQPVQSDDTFRLVDLGFPKQPTALTAPKFRFAYPHFGTAVLFDSLIEREPGSSTYQMNSFQSICFQKEYIHFSPEELRIADYRMNRRYGPEPLQGPSSAASTANVFGTPSHNTGTEGLGGFGNPPSKPFGFGPSNMTQATFPEDDAGSVKHGSFGYWPTVPDRTPGLISPFAKAGQVTSDSTWPPKPPVSTFGQPSQSTPTAEVSTKVSGSSPFGQQPSRATPTLNTPSGVVIEATGFGYLKPKGASIFGSPSDAKPGDAAPKSNLFRSNSTDSFSTPADAISCIVTANNDSNENNEEEPAPNASPSAPAIIPTTTVANTESTLVPHVTPPSEEPKPQYPNPSSRQLALLHLLLFAEKAKWSKLFNAAVDSYFHGEKALRRKMLTEHMSLIYTRTKLSFPDSKLRHMVARSLTAGPSTTIECAAYAVLLREHEEFAKDFVRSLTHLVKDTEMWYDMENCRAKNFYMAKTAEE